MSAHLSFLELIYKSDVKMWLKFVLLLFNITLSTTQMLDWQKFSYLINCLNTMLYPYEQPNRPSHSHLFCES